MPALRPILLLAAAISFGLGITLPLIRLEKLYFFTETPSLIGVVAGLWNQGDMALAALVAAFSLVFPVVKMATVELTMSSSVTTRSTRLRARSFGEIARQL